MTFHFFFFKFPEQKFLNFQVFDQPNLPNYLREIELCVEDNSSPSHKYNSDHWKNNLPPLSPTSNWSTNTIVKEKISVDSPRKQTFSSLLSNSFMNNSILHFEKKWSAILRQKIFELEGPNFCYKPLFSDPPAPEVNVINISCRSPYKYSY